MREMERKKINKEKRTTLPPPIFFFSRRKPHCSPKRPTIVAFLGLVFVKSHYRQWWSQKFIFEKAKHKIRQLIISMCIY